MHLEEISRGIMRRNVKKKNADVWLEFCQKLQKRKSPNIQIRKYNMVSSYGIKTGCSASSTVWSWELSSGVEAESDFLSMRSSWAKRRVRVWGEASEKRKQQMQRQNHQTDGWRTAVAECTLIQSPRGT